MVLSVGTVVAGYTVEGVLGAGGMGTVYRARNPSLPRSDALKVLSAELSQDPQFRARFTREAELAATLDHPNIVTVYNRGETEQQQLWIAMQYVAGTDADAEIREGKMTPARAVHITTEVAKALDYAHRRQLLHRDVKPANFLLTADDEERVFLADFGIARALDEAVGLTQTGMVMASVAYAAPESLGGLPVDHRADIYSLGCSLYRMLVGKSPFTRSGGMAAMVAAHLSEPPPRVTDARPDLPPAIDAVIAKALAKDPDARYQSARELAAATRDALDDTTTALRVTPYPPAQHGWPTTTPPGVPVGSGPQTGYSALTYPSGQFSGPQATTVPASQAPPPGPPRHFAPPYPPHEPAAPAARRRRWPLIAGAMTLVVVIAAVVTGVLLTGGDGDSQPAYQAQTFTHVHGDTTVSSAPTAVAALGPGDGDAVLSLGLQPVAITTTGGGLPSWEKAAVTGTPAVLSGLIDTAAVAAAKPDLIIATGDVDDATYDKLKAIAPTVTRPVRDASAPWTWQDQLTWVGNIVGRADKATSLIDAVRSQTDDVKNQNPAFGGKSVAALAVADAGIGEILVPSNTATYLESLGMRYDDNLRRTPADRGDSRPLQDQNVLYGLKTQVLVVLRTDKAAGAGGYGGLPTGFGAYTGAMVIVDSPDVLAALAEPGGYLATQFLNATLVPTIAQQVR